jgi:CheY-like chemotaxis protein
MPPARGFAVQQAHDGLEAFQKLENQIFDVVVSDVRMPRLNGLDLARRIVDQFAGTRIVLITADQRHEHWKPVI